MGDAAAKQPAEPTKAVPSSAGERERPAGGPELLRMLQRTAGNRAAAAYVQRVKDPWTGGPIPPEAVALKNFAAPTVSGTAVVHADTNPDHLRVDGVTVTVPAVEPTLTKNPPLEDNHPIDVGWIQEVVSSKRTAHYGTGPAEVIDERGIDGSSRDATIAGGAELTHAPFFLPPLTLSEPNAENSAVPMPVHGDMHTTDGKPIDVYDAPAFSLPKERGGAPLTKLTGADSFRTAVGAVDTRKPADPPSIFQTSTWTVPWDVDVTGDAGTSGAAGSSKAGGPAPDVTSGANPQDRARADEHLVLATLDAAKVLDVEALTNALVTSKKRGDTTTYANAAAAIRAKNPTFIVTLGCAVKSSYVMSDDVSITVGTKGFVGKMDKGQTTDLEVQLTDFDDASGALETDVLTAKLVVEGVNAELALTPFAASSTPEAPLATADKDFAPKSGKYHCHIELKH